MTILDKLIAHLRNNLEENMGYEIETSQGIVDIEFDSVEYDDIDCSFRVNIKGKTFDIKIEEI